MLLKVLCHPAAKFGLALLGFIFSLNWVRSMSITFDFYLRLVLGPLLVYRGLIRVFALPMVGLCIFLLIFGVWHTRKASILHKLDVSLLSLFGICLLIFCVRLIFMRTWSALILLLVPLVVYLFAIFILTQVVARIRDDTMEETLYWWRFFNLPDIAPKAAMGILMAILLALLSTELLGAIGLLARNEMLSSASVLWRAWGWRVAVTPVFVFISCIAVSLCVLNYFAAFVLGLSYRYDAANIEKIQSERFKAELIANVSHDIRTPLTSIINYTDLLKNQKLQGDAATYIEVLDKKAIRLKQLLSDLIDASQASSGAIKVDIQPLNLSEMLGQVAGEFSDIFDENDLTLVLRQPAGFSLYVLADSRHLFRAMENVFSNAAKYAMPGTRVFAEIEATGTNVIFTLRNTSKNHIDVPAETLTEQFIRGDLARHSEGSGLGLHIAKSLVELMSGQLQISLRGDLFEVAFMLKV
ncbi:MAG: HAMP domain-containing histidine kinase [Firmicutes bacterium]|nr:HAMP domain-containing histidine kinase [Bacillota bacterium]